MAYTVVQIKGEKAVHFLSLHVQSESCGDSDPILCGPFAGPKEAVGFANQLKERLLPSQRLVASGRDESVLTEGHEVLIPEEAINFFVNA
jgi:hypothetical protein